MSKNNSKNKNYLIIGLLIIIVLLLVLIAFLFESSQKSENQQAMNENVDNVVEKQDGNNIQNTNGIDESQVDKSDFVEYKVYINDDFEKLFSFYHNKNMDVIRYQNDQPLDADYESYFFTNQPVIKIDVFSINQLPENSFGYTKQEALNDIEILKNQKIPDDYKNERMSGYNFEEIVELPENKYAIRKYRFTGGQNGPEFFTLEQKIVFYDNGNQIMMSYYGDVEKAARSIPNHVSEYNNSKTTGSNRTLFKWKTSEVRKLYADIKNRKTSEYIQKWDDDFTKMINSLDI